MNTDTPFYRIFQERPLTVFELAGLPVPANPVYRLHAEEVKQTAFRLDGILMPPQDRDDLPLIFVEAQFYAKRDFYARWLAAIFLFLFRHPGITRRWLAVVVFPDRATDVGDQAPYEPLFGCGLIHRVYLRDLPDDPDASLGARLARITVLAPAAAVAAAQALIAGLSRDPGQAPRHESALDLIETILVYKLPALSRAEIRAMLHLPITDPKQTRYYKDAFADGRVEGRLDGERLLILRQLERRLGPLAPSVRTRIEALPEPALTALGDALLDFASPADLAAWLTGHPG